MKKLGHTEEEIQEFIEKWGRYASFFDENEEEMPNEIKELLKNNIEKNKAKSE